MLLELKGRGCRQFESYLLAQERSWYEFFMDVLMEDGVMKRLDLRPSMTKTGILNIPHLTEKCRNEECYLGLPQLQKPTAAGRTGTAWGKKNVMGNTCCISAPSKVRCTSAFMKKTMSSTKSMIFPIADAEVKNRL